MILLLLNEKVRILGRMVADNGDGGKERSESKLLGTAARRRAVLSFGARIRSKATSTWVLAALGLSFAHAGGCIFLVDDAASGGGGAGAGATATAASSSTESGGAGGQPGPCTASFRTLITAADLAPNASPAATIEDVDSDGTRIAFVVGPGTNSQAERTLRVGELEIPFKTTSVISPVTTSMRIAFVPGAGPRPLAAVWSSGAAVCLVGSSAACDPVPNSPSYSGDPARVEALGSPSRAIVSSGGDLGWIELTNPRNATLGSFQTPARDFVAVPRGVVISGAGETYLCKAAASATPNAASCNQPAKVDEIFPEETIGLSATADEELALVAGIVYAPKRPTNRQVRLAPLAEAAASTPIELPVLDAAASVAISPSGLLVSRATVSSASLTLCCGESADLVSLTSPALACDDVAPVAPLFLELVPHGARQVIGRTEGALYLIELTPSSG
jgi:hypothetical protein